MPARKRRGRPAASTGRTRCAGATAVLLGATLLALAIPVAGAALTRLPGDGVLRDLRSGSGTGPAAVQRLLDSRRAALQWRRDPRDLADRGLAQALLAREIRTTPSRTGRSPAAAETTVRARLRAAERALSASLGAAPADPYAWTRLALVRWRLDRPADSVRVALHAARATGPQLRRLRPVQRALAARLSGAADG